MDTVHAVSKRIEQALTQLERELKRNGFELPTETFTVTTGDGITVEAASRPAPLPAAEPTEIFVKPEYADVARELIKSARNKKSEPSDDATPPA